MRFDNAVFVWIIYRITLWSEFAMSLINPTVEEVEDLQKFLFDNDIRCLTDFEVSYWFPEPASSCGSASCVFPGQICQYGGSSVEGQYKCFDIPKDCVDNYKDSRMIFTTAASTVDSTTGSASNDFSTTTATSPLTTVGSFVELETLSTFTEQTTAVTTVVQWGRKTPKVVIPKPRRKPLTPFERHRKTGYTPSFRFSIRNLSRKQKVRKYRPPKCKDSSPLCERWAYYGECTNNAMWMQKNCQVSCYQCYRGPNIQLYRPGNCHDAHLNCQFWRYYGQCTANAAYMRWACSASCGVC